MGKFTDLRDRLDEEMSPEFPAGRAHRSGEADLGYRTQGDRIYGIGNKLRLVLADGKTLYQGRIEKKFFYEPGYYGPRTKVPYYKADGRWFDSAGIPCADPKGEPESEA